ncbi:hypothetical protein, variant [Exophiala mesophila]|uniref:Uncharacterized protein n=1 Tax=Exophiala mesophila TaxID=212818 RepID=A0A0D1ZMC8_EXOME|nr:uncharacterized protein PV10_03414 [Exophiala mesophila]XP_016227382.1 hypothetical protein, variant [Exophiala mesophila]KIV95807.1 hypothetical protein PV10_03414 [Exophiala mesophila]KIV95808.1 hypothetical protein, variant [Exophiala mesophila]
MAAPSHQSVVTTNAPNPMPTVFPQAVVTANGFVFCSGNIAMDPQTLKVIDGDIQAHTHRIIQNISAVLDAAGTSLARIVKINIFLANMDDFARMNEVYVQYFQTNLPARTCVAVKTLPFNTDIEVECTALL